MAASDQENSESASVKDEGQARGERLERREIKGGIPYTMTPNVFKKSLEQILIAERPEKFTANFMATVLKQSGGSSRAVPPLFKKMNFLATDGTPTTLYSKFKTEGGRSQAAYDGLKQAFAELFRRNEYIHKADEASVKDLMVEITGLKKNDPIIRSMYSTFDSIRAYITKEPSLIDEDSTEEKNSASTRDDNVGHSHSNGANIGLSYHINIVLPETDNISVFNAIFRSLRDNLLR